LGTKDAGENTVDEGGWMMSDLVERSLPEEGFRGPWFCCNTVGSCMVTWVNRGFYREPRGRRTSLSLVSLKGLRCVGLYYFFE